MKRGSLEFVVVTIDPHMYNLNSAAALCSVYSACSLSTASGKLLDSE